MSIDERTIVADVKSYIDSLEGFRAEVEEHTPNMKRMDLTLYNGRTLICTAEFKRPTTIEGKTPRNFGVVMDAFLKASNKNKPPRFFITSNFNETILWDNSDVNKPVMARDVYTLYLDKKIIKDDDFEDDDVKEDIKKKMQELVQYIEDLYEGVKKVYYKPLGESFILGLNAHLESASSVIKRHVPNKILQRWWKEQDYAPKISFSDSDREKIAKYSLYVLANKIVFYYVLRRMFPPIQKIDANRERIEELKAELDSCFSAARQISGDYETVFEESEADLISFQDQENLDSVKALINFLENYDFSDLTQDLLGNIYDRLISPEERHANGQYYTPIPIVDLINALTIRKKDARVMDPACGSGTFLSRAFDLKLRLYGKEDGNVREAIIEDIFGCDIAAYPAHLATVALASKLLMYNPSVYPNILRKDFLDIMTTNVIPKLRTEYEESLKNHTISLIGEEKPVSFKPIDAFVGNLPYIRGEEIPNKEDERRKVKDFLSQNSYADTGEEYLYLPDMSADFHVYFWYYLLPFLKEGSMVSFLTSDTWMNVEYGDGFKKFLNRYFKIRYIIDSSVERWFEDALVNTVITVIERTNSREERENSEIKFVRINKRISKIINDLDDAMRIAEAIEKDYPVDGITIVRKVRQADIGFNNVMKSKLFQYLRGPKEFFEITNNKNMIPLDKIMDVKFGIKTGADSFFYVSDITDKYSNDDLKMLFGLRRGEINRIRVIKDGANVTHLIEKKYLFPILKSPKEFTIPGKLVFNQETKKNIVLIKEVNKSDIEKYALEYLEYGENNPHGAPHSESSTCKSRKPWWKLSPIIVPEMAFPDQLGDTYIFPKTSYYLNKKLYFMNLKDDYKDDLISVYSFLNSSLSFLYPDLICRNYGGGTTSCTIYEAKMFPVPKPEVLRPYYSKLESIMRKMENRSMGSVFEEIWDTNGEFSLNKVEKDRLELDRTILEALGFKDPDKFLIFYYPFVVRIIKERLDKAKSVKTSNKKGKVSLSKVADDLIKHLNVKDFPQDYINKIAGTLKIRKGSKILIGTDLVGNFVSIDGEKEYYDTDEMTRYVYYCSLRGLDRVPVPADLKSVLSEFKEDLESWRNKIMMEIDTITDDEKYKDKLFELCIKKLNYPMLDKYS